MCLLVMVARPGSAEPLVVGANRDERGDRPAVPLAVLQGSGPRILGGRDLLAGGTWLAVNEHGVVAGLTNRPQAAGRDPTKRSRGILPVLAAQHPSAAAAVEALAEEVDPAQFNPGWLLVGDRAGVFAVTVAGRRPTIERLGAGVHVLENRRPGERSAKVRWVESLLDAGAGTPAGGELRRRLAEVLADHRPAPGPDPVDDDRRARLPGLLAACVHGDGYGTRSSVLVVVGADRGAPPRLWVADGPPCAEPFVDRSAWWAADGVAG